MVVETSADDCVILIIEISFCSIKSSVIFSCVLLLDSQSADILDGAVDAGRRTMVQSLPGDPSNRTDVLPFPEAIQGVHLFVRRTEHYLDRLSDGWMER